jgi:subtilisin family serine protease
MIVVEVVDSTALRHVINAPGVTGVYEDLPMRKQLVQSLPLIDQPSVASAGYRGTGTTIAVIDSGIDYTRAAFGGCTSPGVPAGCKVIVSQDFAPSDGLLDDPDLHGTNVAAIAIGVAPEARLAALDVFAGEFANTSNVLAAINWCIANQATYRIVAINLSLGVDQFSAPCDASAFATAFRGARSAGILPVVASGNAGSLSTVSNPACVPGALSVGAVYDSNVGAVNWESCSDASTSADRVVCFSNASSFLSMLAPGELI